MATGTQDRTRAKPAGTLARGLDRINEAIRDGFIVHGIERGPVATDGESIEVRCTTLGRTFTIVILPGTLDEPDAPAILRPGAGFGGGDGCGDEPRAYPVGHGFSVVGAGEEE